MAGPKPESRAALAGPAGMPAALLLAVLSGIWAWWAWQDGAYFATVMLPGTIVLCLTGLLFLRLVTWPEAVAITPTAGIAIASLVALGCWAALSAIWSASPDVAIADSQRILTYALAFGLGLWLAGLLGPRLNLALVPVAFAATVAGVAAIVGLLTDDPLDVLDAEGTLSYPLGYRNAEAAFFAISLFAGLGLAADRERAWWLRAIALGAAALSIQCFLLAQSRGSVLAMAAALVVYTLAAPRRVRALSWLLLAVIFGAAIIPSLTSLYEAFQDRPAQAVDEMRSTGAVAAGLTIAAIVIGAGAAKLESRLPGLGTDSRRGNRVVAVGLVAVAIAGVTVFVARVGDPIDWFGKRAEEFRSGGSPDLTEQSSRFGFSAGSDRYDLWRVAIDDATNDPLLGVGGGGYQDSYLVDRDVDYQQVRDAHSVELESAAEFGFPGLIMLLAAIVAAGIGVIATLRRGPPGVVLGAAVAGSATYWLAHTSIDWFWQYPAVTAPVFGLLGAAAVAPARGPSGSRIRWRPVVAAGLIVLAVSAVPPFLSERYINDAYASWRTDLGRAYDDLDRARALNPLSDDALLAEAAISTAAGERQRAIDALREAEDKRPEEWATHFLLARLQVRSDRAEARRQLAIAASLNPLEERIRTLAKRLDVPVPKD